MNCYNEWGWQYFGSFGGGRGKLWPFYMDEPIVHSKENLAAQRDRLTFPPQATGNIFKR
jgi:hypothetical protein